ncbi:MAG: hypothetical protein WAK18_11970 [Nocardioidaceae bacterium]
MSRRLWMLAPVTVLALSLNACGTEHANDPYRAQDGVGVLAPADFGSTIAAAQAKAQSAHVQGTVTSDSGTVRMAGNFSTGKTADDLVLDLTLRVGPGQVMTMRFLDRVFYMKASQAMLTGKANRPWVKIDLDDPKNPFGAILDQMFSNLDPAHLAKFYASVKKLNNLGIDDIDGIKARHYVVSVETAKVIKLMNLDKIPGTSVAAIKAQLPKTLTSQIWIDADGRPVKTRSEVAGSTTELVYSAWGKSVHVKAPPANQIGTLRRGGH